MKPIPTIVIAILSILIIGLTWCVYDQGKRITFLAGNATQWKGKYDSAKMIWLNQYSISYNRDSIWFCAQNKDTAIVGLTVSFSNLLKHLPNDDSEWSGLPKVHPIRHAKHGYGTSLFGKDFDKSEFARHEQMLWNRLYEAIKLQQREKEESFYPDYIYHDASPYLQLLPNGHVSDTTVIKNPFMTRGFQRGDTTIHHH